MDELEYACIYSGELNTACLFGCAVLSVLPFPCLLATSPPDIPTCSPTLIGYRSLHLY